MQILGFLFSHECLQGGIKVVTYEVFLCSRLASMAAATNGLTTKFFGMQSYLSYFIFLASVNTKGQRRFEQL
jgi:hypothetical protein